MNAECPYCRAAERDRIEALYLKQIQIDKSSSVLHFAPERWLFNYFTKLEVERYWPVDIDEKNKTLERKEYNTDQLRIKYYGEANHVRMYGNDFALILQKNGLLAEKIYAKHLSENFRKNRLKKNEYFGFVKNRKAKRK